MGMYDRQAADARKQAKSNFVWVWFNVVFVAVNTYSLISHTRLWPVHFIAVIGFSAMGVCMYLLSIRSRDLAKRWDDLSVEHAPDMR